MKKFLDYYKPTIFLITGLFLLVITLVNFNDSSCSLFCSLSSAFCFYSFQNINYNYYVNDYIYSKYNQYTEFCIFVLLMLNLLFLIVLLPIGCVK